MENTGELLYAKRSAILELWVQQQLAFRQADHVISDARIRLYSTQFLNTTVAACRNGNFTDITSIGYEDVVKALNEICSSHTDSGFPPRYTILFVLGLKQALAVILRQEYSGRTRILYHENLRVNKLIDSLATLVFEIFLKNREELVKRQITEINGITDPIIRLWEGVLVVPIIGILDMTRAQEVIEALLTHIVKKDVAVVILDISGIGRMDSGVAHHLVQTAAAAKLIGSECIISGMRPEIAQIIILSEIDLSQVTTKATIAEGLRYAFEILKIEVNPARD